MASVATHCDLTGGPLGLGSPCPESRKGMVRAGLALHPQSLTSVGSPEKFVSAQVICNGGHVRLCGGFANKENKESLGDWLLV